MMEKDSSIFKVVQLIKAHPDLKSVELVDYWDADLCAIGFRKVEKLVYISTCYCEENKYDFDFELLDLDDLKNLNTIRTGRSVSQADLIAEIINFFNTKYDNGDSCRI